MSYWFGFGDLICGYIDGEEVDGDWDFGGVSDVVFVVDDDELWIGFLIVGNLVSLF